MRTRCSLATFVGRLWRCAATESAVSLPMLSLRCLLSMLFDTLPCRVYQKIARMRQLCALVHTPEHTRQHTTACPKIPYTLVFANFICGFRVPIQIYSIYIHKWKIMPFCIRCEFWCRPNFLFFRQKSLWQNAQNAQMCAVPVGRTHRCDS